jgi:hypothetical protein
VADYYVVVKPKGDFSVWEWKIQRRSKPMGVQLQGSGYGSPSAAQIAGDEALKEFFKALSREHNRNYGAKL